VEVEAGSVRPRRGQRGRDRRGGVDDEQVAGAQVRGQAAKAVVDERGAVAARDQQPHLVALEPVRLGRRGGLVRRRQREGERAAHARDSISAPAA
jgi:hypothetical protein